MKKAKAGASFGLSFAYVINRCFCLITRFSHKEQAMLYVGVDLHKQSISLCVVELADRERKIIERRKIPLRRRGIRWRSTLPT